MDSPPAMLPAALGSTDIDFYVEHIMPAEVAGELLNAARARIFARLDQLDPATSPAVHLVGRAANLRRLQCQLTPRSNAQSHAVIAKWGPLLQDDAAFWRELQEGGRA